jgi:hypothetical protein
MLSMRGVDWRFVDVTDRILSSSDTPATERYPYAAMVRPLWEALTSVTKRPARRPPGLQLEIGGPPRDLVAEVTSQVLRKLRSLSSDSSDEAPEDEGLVFVICSFDAALDPVFDAVSCAAASVGLRAERMKDHQGDYRITDRILTLIRSARLVVADLSYERPNVYFELGYARGLDKTVITMARTGTVPHFDVRDWTYLEYMDSRPLERLLRERFRFEIESGAPVAGRGPDPAVVAA